MGGEGWTVGRLPRSSLWPLVGGIYSVQSRLLQSISCCVLCLASHSETVIPTVVFAPGGKHAEPSPCLGQLAAQLRISSNYPHRFRWPSPGGEGGSEESPRGTSSLPQPGLGPQMSGFSSRSSLIFMVFHKQV